MEGIHFWPEVLKALSSKLNNPLFQQWIPLTYAIYNAENDSVTISVPNNLIKDSISDHVAELTKIIDEIMLKETKITVVIEKNKSSAPRRDEETKIIPVAKNAKRIKKNMFIPRFTFENFVVGSNNQFAHAAALSVAVRPSKSYNPLFLFGNSGLGKTHLLHAIGNYVSEYLEKVKAIYINGERFLNEYINSIRTKTTDAFRKKFREDYDILLIDDVQFIAGKGQSQEELFHAISNAQDNNKQIVLASDKFPNQIEGLDKRLKTRFASGLICDIKPPELETRVAIVKNKTRELNIAMSQEAAIKTAELFPNSIRELEGAITSIGAFASFADAEISPDFIDEIFYEKKLTIKEKKTIDINKIIRKVASHFNITYSELIGTSRKKELVLPRHVSIYIAKKLCNRSLTDLAKSFKRKNHASIIHACERIEEKQKSDPNLRRNIEYLISELKNS